MIGSNQSMDIGTNVGIWKGSELLEKKNYGYADMEKLIPMEWNPYIRIGSISKMFTATVIMKLSQENKISLSDKLSKYFDDVDDRITIEHLGTMTSGIYDYASDKEFNKMLDSYPLKKWTPYELLNVARTHDLVFVPGSKWQYSNTNTVYLGLIAEMITGKSLEELYGKYIFNPLDLRNTYVPLDSTIRNPHPNGYMIGKNADNLDNNLYNVTNMNPSWGWGCGEIISTVEDLNVFVRYFINNILRRDTVVKTHIDMIEYGFGFLVINKKWFGHNGQIPGFQTIVLYSPESDLSLIVSTNIYADEDLNHPADKLALKLIDSL